MILEYIKKVISKWWIILGIILELFDRFQKYFNIDLKIPEGYTSYLLFALLFISTYLVWKDEKQKLITLEEKNRNPVDYEITAQIHPFDDDVENSIIKLENNINDTQKELDDINIKSNEEIRIKIDKNNLPDLQNKSISLNIAALQSIQQHRLSSEDTITQNLREISYKNSLETYITDMKKYIDDMKDYYETRKGKIFYVIFVIHNTGSIFDENIGISISSKNSIFAEKLHFDNTLVKPKKPEKPKNSIYQEPLFSNYLQDIEKQLNNLELNPHRLRRNVEIKNKNINLVFRDLKVDNEKNVLENILFIKSDDLNDLEFEISSKNSNRKIQKKVKLEMKDKLTKQNIYNMLHPNEND